MVFTICLSLWLACLSYRCEFGVLNTYYGEGDLELYQGDPGLTIEGWQSVPRISLREAALKNNPKNDFFASRCQCTTKCTTASCSCKKGECLAQANAIRVQSITIRTLN